MVFFLCLCGKFRFWIWNENRNCPEKRTRKAANLTHLCIIPVHAIGCIDVRKIHIMLNTQIHQDSYAYPNVIINNNHRHRRDHFHFYGNYEFRKNIFICMKVCVLAFGHHQNPIVTLIGTRNANARLALTLRGRKKMRAKEKETKKLREKDARSWNE